MCAQKPFGAVSLYRFPYFFARYESDLVAWALPVENHEIRGMPYFVGMPVYPLERFRVGDTLEVPDRSDSLYRQSFSAFGATRIDHFTAVFRLHTGAKSVCTFSRCVVRLISTFHDISFYGKLVRPRLLQSKAASALCLNVDAIIPKNLLKRLYRY